MIIVKGTTKRGMKLLEMGGNCYHSYLYQLYDKWSQAKEIAFNECWEMYCNGNNTSAFGIGNANTFGFTASWNETINGLEGMRIETKDNSYFIIYPEFCD